MILFFSCKSSEYSYKDVIIIAFDYEPDIDLTLQDFSDQYKIMCIDYLRKYSSIPIFSVIDYTFLEYNDLSSSLKNEMMKFDNVSIISAGIDKRKSEIVYSSAMYYISKSKNGHSFSYFENDSITFIGTDIVNDKATIIDGGRISKMTFQSVLYSIVSHLGRDVRWKRNVTIKNINFEHIQIIPYTLLSENAHILMNKIVIVSNLPSEYEINNQIDNLFVINGEEYLGSELLGNAVVKILQKYY